MCPFISRAYVTEGIVPMVRIMRTLIVRVMYASRPSRSEYNAMENRRRNNPCGIDREHEEALASIYAHRFNKALDVLGRTLALPQHHRAPAIGATSGGASLPPRACDASLCGIAIQGSHGRYRGLDTKSHASRITRWLDRYRDNPDIIVPSPAIDPDLIERIKRKNENVRKLDGFIKAQQGSFHAQVIRGERGNERES